MRQKSGLVKEPANKVVKEIRLATRRQFPQKRRSALCWKAYANRANKSRQHRSSCGPSARLLKPHLYPSQVCG